MTTLSERYRDKILCLYSAQIAALRTHATPSFRSANLIVGTWQIEQYPTTEPFFPALHYPPTHSIARNKLSISPPSPGIKWNSASYNTFITLGSKRDDEQDLSDCQAILSCHMGSTGGTRALDIWHPGDLVTVLHCPDWGTSRSLEIDSR